MALKSLLFVSLLVVGFAAPLAEAQLGQSISIQGTLFCTANGNIGVNGTATPVFSNAQVKLQCGAPGNVVVSATTNATGQFSISLNSSLQIRPLSLIANCSLVVNTPLSTCNASLAGILSSQLLFVGTTGSGTINIIPVGFTVNPLELISIQGTLFCTANGNISVNGTATPVFPNAEVKLQCGTPGNVVASATTNATGQFLILLNPLPILLSPQLPNCTLVVNTTLSTCNASLPAMLLPVANQKFETLSYFAPLGPESFINEIEYLFHNGWVPYLDFDLVITYQGV